MVTEVSIFSPKKSGMSTTGTTDKSSIGTKNYMKRRSGRSIRTRGKNYLTIRWMSSKSKMEFCLPMKRPRRSLDIVSSALK